MTRERPKVFISYSHQDEAWKERLVSHLRVFELEGALDVWDDRRIAAGDDWRSSIEQALERAAVAILIVSKHFLTSKFIREEELTRILAGRSEGRLWVIPLIAEPCAWQAVSALQRIEARPRNGSPLSAGTAHQIDADLTALAIEVVDGLGRREATPPGTRSSIRAQRMTRSAWLLACLSVSVLSAVLLLVAATYWRLTTSVSIDLVTERVSFVVRGTRQVFDPGLQFSALTVERCARAIFEGIRLANVDASAEPQATAARPRISPTTVLTCRDPAAKITLTTAGESPVILGTLPPMTLDPGTTVGISVAGRSVPVLTLELFGHPLTVDVPIQRDLDVVADFVDVGETPVGQPTGLMRYPATLREAPRHVAQFETSDRGGVLVVALTSESLRAPWKQRERLPIESVRVDKESLGGVATTALLDDGSLSYLDYPTIPSLLIPKDNAIIVTHIEQAHVRTITLGSVEPLAAGGSPFALKLTVEGDLVRAVIGTGDRGRPDQPNLGRWVDPRLTVLDTLTDRPWTLAAVGLAWIGTTLCTAYLGWRKLSQ